MAQSLLTQGLILYNTVREEDMLVHRHTHSKLEHNGIFSFKLFNI